MENFSNGVKGGTMCLSKAGLAIGSTPAQVSTAAPNGAGIDFAIDGILYHFVDDATAPISAAAVQAALTTCLYLVQLNAAGTLSTVKGTAVNTAALAAGSAILKIPTPTALNCPIGLLKVVCALTATFTAATTDLDATNVTTTYQDLMALPPQPRTS